MWRLNGPNPFAKSQVNKYYNSGRQKTKWTLTVVIKSLILIQQRCV